MIEQLEQLVPEQWLPPCQVEVPVSQIICLIYRGQGIYQ